MDVFPGNLAYPVRLDFFGDELEEIRRIVPTTGQTIASLPGASIYPVVEFSCSKSGLARARKKLERPAATNPALREMLEKMEGGLRFDGADALLPYLYNATATLGDYAPPDALAALIEPRSLFDDMAHAHDDVLGRAKGSGIAAAGLYAEPADVSFGACQRATYVSIMRVGGQVDDELPVKRVEVAGHPDKLFGRLRSLVDGGYTVVFSAPNFRSRQDMKLAFVDHGLPIQETLGVLDDGAPEAVETPGAAKRRLRRGVVNVVDVDIPLGMIIPKAKLALVSVSDTQGASSAALRPSRRVDITEVTFPYQPGDYVVHAAHGVAHFKELVRRDVDGTARDYLLLEYAEGDKLYVPVEQLDRVTRYVGPEGASPRLTRLNTADWSRALAKARKATKKLAFDLVDVYARRASDAGLPLRPRHAAQREMEEAFPYQETPDQLAAIADVKADMQSAQPMDRLVCGDVGFGKTEVALRAAFKATQDGKQVMVLCPTTILAQQHYTNFKERCEPFGVRVEVLSRFRTPAQQAEALRGFQEGDVDVLVGTHRLLSRDVNPHDLGLVVIDEEQRFGVGHKEQLKNLRESIDVLTLSATPIPRTMQMSLSGVRDMSLILTPPDERRPVEVHVGEWDPDLVSAAIRRELARGGQVYYVSQPRALHRRGGAPRDGGRRRGARGRGARADVEGAAGARDGGLQRRRAGRAGGHHHHRERHRQPAHQHACHRGLAAAGPGADVPAQGPRGALVHAGLRLLHVPRAREPHRGGRGAPDRPGRAHRPGQRHAHRHARLGDPRSGQHAGRRAVRQHVRRGLRPVRADAGAGGERHARGRPQGRRRAAARRSPTSR